VVAPQQPQVRGAGLRHGRARACALFAQSGLALRLASVRPPTGGFQPRNAM